MSVLNVTNAAIYSKLAANSTLTTLLNGTAIYYQQAPDNQALPFVVFSLQAGGPDNINPSDLRNQLYFVRGYAATPALAGSIDAQCSTSLHGATLTVSGYTNFWTVRENDFAMPINEPNGARSNMAGAYYRIRLDS
ncbi:MAG: DUF3168 domain-containing protein [Desulfurellales bacterium]|nr:MAG: DUF3168 domain-containing protein [Desulfurellales bacterium]